MNWWSRLWRRDRMEQQLEKELRFHLDEHANGLIAQGRDADEAQREAKLAMGSVEQVKERCRDARGTRWLENFWQDLRYAARTYRRALGFTLTALVAISLGIGATTAVFSVTDRILFRPLPFRADGQLVSFGMRAKVVDDGEFLFATDYRQLSEENTPFQAITSWSGVRDCDITDRNAVREHCAEIEPNFLTVLGIHPILGANFSEDDARPGAPEKVILSYALWRSRFAGDKEITGKTLMLDGAPVRITGVLPGSFELPTLQRADLLVPQIILPAGLRPGATRVLRVIGRLKPGISLPEARAQLAPAFDRMLSYVPRQFRKEVEFHVRSIRDRQMGAFRVAAWTLLGAALAVILISCTNVANLLVARAAGRQAEIAIRAAIGISRGRLLCQMLTESLLLAVTGGAVGCALGWVLLRILVWADPYGIPHLADATLDGRVLAVSLGLSLLAGLVFGLAPAFQQPDTGTLGSSCRVAARSSTAVKNTLVAAQIALSIVLLTGAGLLVRSLWNLENQPLGMHSQHVLTAQLVLPSSRYTKPEERIAVFNRIEQQVGSIPGVQAMGLSDSLPPGGWERSRPIFTAQVVGHPRREQGTGGMVEWRYVSPGYFEALRIPVIKGRLFKEEDRRPGVNLAIISQSFERRILPGQDAVGKYLTFKTGDTTNSVPYQVVGVVPDVKNTGLSTSDSPEYYILRTHSPDDTYLNSTGQATQRMLSLVVRSSIPENALIASVRREIATVDPALPVEIASMHERLDGLAAGPRFDTILLLLFAAVGLLLAAVGLYGTISYLVAQRTQEIGIRMSVGATPAAIARLMFAYSAKWTLAGAALGVLASLITTRLLSSLLYRVTARDPLTLIVSIACLVFAALLATAHPVHEAARIDPVIALRTDN